MTVSDYLMLVGAVGVTLGVLLVFGVAAAVLCAGVLCLVAGVALDLGDSS